MFVLFDFSVSFDTLSRSKLYGIRGVNSDFIKAYYENRSQYVCYDAVESSIRSQELEVMQGWKTGPFFFVIYSSDFARKRSYDEIILYADDTVFVYVGTSLEMLTENVNSRLREIF